MLNLFTKQLLEGNTFDDLFNLITDISNVGRVITIINIDPDLPTIFKIGDKGNILDFTCELGILLYKVENEKGLVDYIPDNCVQINK